MRVAVIGTSGSGKSTFAARLSAATGIDRIELDLLNWRPGWYDRHKEEPDAFMMDLRKAIGAEHWVCAGGYSMTRPTIWSRATHVVWLDLQRALVMRQVVLRSLSRTVSGKDVFPGCKETWPRLFTAEHPIRWAWSTHTRRRAQFLEMLAEPAYAHLEVIRCQSRTAVQSVLKALTSQIRSAGPQES